MEQNKAKTLKVIADNVRANDSEWVSQVLYKLFMSEVEVRAYSGTYDVKCYNDALKNKFVVAKLKEFFEKEGFKINISVDPMLISGPCMCAHISWEF
jgi:hypothetical protein